MQLFFMGDSITLGVNDSERLGWPGRVCSRLDPAGMNITAYNLGVRASTTEHIRKRWVSEIERRVVRGKTGALVFSFGVADVANGLTAEQSLENAREILWRADSEYKTLFICPSPVSDEAKNRKVAELVEKYVQLCSELDIPCLDINYSLQRNESFLEDIGRGDGVHPGSTGYGIMADIIYDFLRPAVRPHLE